jgi:hypothetical protein
MRTANIPLHWVLHFPAISRQTGSKGKKKEKNLWPFGKQQKQHLDMHGYFFRGVSARLRREKWARYKTALLVCRILTESNGVSASVSVNLWVIFFLTFEYLLDQENGCCLVAQRLINWEGVSWCWEEIDQPLICSYYIAWFGRYLVIPVVQCPI